MFWLLLDGRRCFVSLETNNGSQHFSVVSLPFFRDAKQHVAHHEEGLPTMPFSNQAREVLPIARHEEGLPTMPFSLIQAREVLPPKGRSGKYQLLG